MMKLFVLFVTLLSLQSVHGAKKPNIVYILTDDQDVRLYSLESMRKVRSELTQKGLYFDNAFATTPVGCPSRASILTGKYVHNHGTYESSVATGCASESWRRNHEPKTMAKYLSDAGYTTGLFGEYLSNYGLKETGKNYTYIPEGWDTWYGLVGGSKFYDYTVSNQGHAESHSNKYKQDYFTDRVSDQVQKFIKDNAKRQFFAYVSPPAPHRPADSAPQYAKMFFSQSAPRTPNYGVVGINKHWMVSIATPPLNREGISRVNVLYRDRLRSLQSVDDLVDKIVSTLDDNKILDNTFIIYSSDHGYHLGQFNLQGEKRQPYEEDIRVPLIVRGPRVPTYKNATALALNIDIAPTILDLAGVTIPDDMDGVSLKSSILPKDVNEEATESSYNFMLEYYGEGDKSGCIFEEGFIHDCHNNTWRAFRGLNVTTKTEFMYASFYSNDSFPIDPKQHYFSEYYDLTKDPYEMSSKAQGLSHDIVTAFEDAINDWYKCSGKTCHTLRQNGFVMPQVTK